MLHTCPYAAYLSRAWVKESLGNKLAMPIFEPAMGLGEGESW